MTPDRFLEVRRLLEDARTGGGAGSGVLIEGSFRYRDRRAAASYEVVDRSGRVSVVVPRMEAGSAEVVAELPIRRLALSRLRGSDEPWGIELGEAGHGATVAPILLNGDGFHVPLLATTVDWEGGPGLVPGGRKRSLVTPDLLAARLKMVDCAGFDRDEHWGFPGLGAETSLTGVDASLHEVKDSTFLERRGRAREFLSTLSFWGGYAYARASEPVLWTGGRHGPVLIPSGPVLRLGLERIGSPDKIMGLGELEGRFEEAGIVVARPAAFSIDGASASAVHLVCAVRRVIEDGDDERFDEATRMALQALSLVQIRPENISGPPPKHLIEAIAAFASIARKGSPIFDHLFKLRGIVVPRVAARLGIELGPEPDRRQAPSFRVVA